MGTEAQIRRERISRLLNAAVWPATHPSSAPLRLSVSRLPGEPIPPAEARHLRFEPLEVGQPWGGAWSTAWIRAEGQVPDSFAGRHVVARVNLGYHHQPGFGGEALAFSGLEHPVPVQGINPKHNTIEIAEKATGGAPVDLLVEAAANPSTWQGGLTGPLLMPDYGGAIYRLQAFDLAVVDDELVSALYDWVVLLELADSLGFKHRRAAEILHVLDGVARQVDLKDVHGSVLRQRHRWQALLDRPAGPSAHRVTAVGHAHIDSAWLWPIRETKRKCARTFSTAIRLMESHPDFVFVCSQAQQHAWMEQSYPELFEQMKERVAAGQLEPVGSMWVEPDTNTPSGESLARQLIAGKRYFLERYGVETTDCWLPDAFGYSGNLPQILQAAGVSRFLTQKLSWNEIDSFPHHTFWWEGIDGTRVLAHCPPTDTYNGEFTVGQLLAGDKRFAQHAVSNRSLYVYGFGDGGGGPTEEMLERARRVATLEPLPKVEMGTARSFFEALEADAGAADERDARDLSGTVRTAHAPGPGGLPVWVGELYLERHRGVQTTQAASKLGNRRSENLLREAELLVASALDGEEADTAAAVLDAAWRTVLLHQFHDILPGSSIHWVHRDSREAYAEVARTVGAVIDTAAERLAARACTPSRPDKPSAATLLVISAASQPRIDLVEVHPDPAWIDEPPTTAVAPDGRELPIQHLADGRLIFPARVPGSGWARFELVSAPEPATELEHPAQVSDDGRTLSNGLVSVTLAEDGRVSSILDLLNEREVIAPGERGNTFQLHYDLPAQYDAWEVEQGTFERAEELTQLESMEVVEAGPVRAAVRIVRRLGERTVVTQEVRVAAASRRVEFATEVDWHERHRLLKVAFPADVRSPHATYEVQFGHLERPTHANTSWDAARFEVPAQRFAELSEHGFGVALLNDCKYGYDIRDNVIRLSLLRGAAWPDPEADEGVHHFSYAILPHGRRYGADQVTHEAECFNLPLSVVVCPADAAEGVAGSGSMLKLEGATLSALKRADDGSGELVVRLYESLGTHGRAVLADLPERAAARRVDLLERDLGLGDLAIRDGSLALDLRPFELVTLRIRSTELPGR